LTLEPELKRILVGVGGGIAAYKAAMVVSQLAQRQWQVRVAITPAGEQFIGRATLAALSGHAVASGMFEPDSMPLGPHIELATGIDLMIVAPATADLIAKFSHGIADSLLSALYLQVQCPVLVAPAMSNAMWEKASVQRNVRQLQLDGVHFVGPDSGWLSCRRNGPGRMSEPAEIVQHAERLIDGDSLPGN
jgi:phosphopantothenoylcysteine decarboxylase/phosphopantothenate--cysteine ligase